MSDNTYKGGINCTAEQLSQGNCSFNINETIGIRNGESAQDVGLTNVVQDFFLGATFFIGTVATIGLIYSGFQLIVNSSDSGAQSKAIQGIKYAMIGIAVTALSYTIIRLVQYIARG